MPTSASRCFILETDSALHNKIPDKEVAQSHVFYPRALGPVADDVQSRGIGDLCRYAVEERIKS